MKLTNNNNGSNTIITTALKLVTHIRWCTYKYTICNRMSYSHTTMLTAAASSNYDKVGK